MSELDKRGWSRSEAARRGKISASMFDKVINGYAQPGMRFIEGIARAFGMSPSEILEIAKTNKKETPISERIRNVVINLSEEDQTDILEYARHRRRLAEERGRYETNKGTTRDTSSP